MRGLLAFALLAAACNSGFEPQYRVNDLRILGIRAEVMAAGTSYADVTPGDTVQLAALVADPLSRGPSVQWYACLPDGTDALPPCLDPEILKDPSSLPGQAGVLLLGQGSSISLDTSPYAAALEQALASVIDRAQQQPTYQCLLYEEIPIVVVAEAGGVRDVALKRVRLAPRAQDLAPYPALQGKYVRNENPGVPNARHSKPGTPCGDGPLVGDPFPSGRLTVCAFAPAGSTQQYDVCDDAGNPIDPQSIESLTWQWYVTAGEFPGFGGVGNATGDDPDFERPADGFTMWLIVRDGRGGEAWASYDLTAVPP